MRVAIGPPFSGPLTNVAERPVEGSRSACQHRYGKTTSTEWVRIQERTETPQKKSPHHRMAVAQVRRFPFFPEGFPFARGLPLLISASIKSYRDSRIDPSIVRSSPTRLSWVFYQSGPGDLPSRPDREPGRLEGEITAGS